MGRTFEPELELFRYHLPVLPVVPGVALLTDFARHQWPDGAGPLAFRQVRFPAFVSPGQRISHEVDADGSARISADGTVRATFTVLPPGSAEMPQRNGAVRAPQRLVSPLRPAQYWFLPDAVQLDPGQGVAGGSVDLDGIGAALPYLKKIDDWRVLVLVECLGNLALALQHAGSAAERPYVFAGFDSLTVDPRKPVSAVTVQTRLRRRGSILLWDGDGYDADSTLLSVRGGVSTVWRSR